MSAVYYDPIVTGESNSPDTINTRLSSLDAAEFANYTELSERISTIINLNPGPSEVVDARTAINYKSGTPPSTLSNALEWAALDVANVLAFGATGDGVTLDTTAIQNAITNHKIVYFPPGDYKIGALTIPSNRLLFSNGGATLLVSGSGVYGLTLEGSNITLRGLKIQGFIGTLVANEIGVKMHMDAADLTDVIIDGCTFNALNYAIRFAADQAARTAKRITITNCNFTNLKTLAIGMLVSPTIITYSMADIRIDSNRFEDVGPDSGKGVGSGAFGGICYIGDLTSVSRLYLVNNIALRVSPMFFAMSNTTLARTDFVVMGNIVRQEAASVVVNMSYQFVSVDNLIFDGNTCSYVDYEHLFLSNCKNFKISNSHFSWANVGIGIEDTAYNYRSWGEITNCTFQDVECPSGENTGHKGIYITSDSAEVDISNCNFIKMTGTKNQLAIDSRYQNTSSGNRAKWARVYSTSEFTWTQDGATNSYYLRRTGNINPSIPLPVTVYESPASGTTALAAGTLGSLAAGQWAFGDNNSLGYKTLYVRLVAGSGAPGDNAISAAYPRLGLNVAHCRFGRQLAGINVVSGGSLAYFAHADITSCVFIGCNAGIILTFSVGCLVAYNRFNGCIIDIQTVNDVNGLRACYNLHMNTNPTNAAFCGAYVIDVASAISIWEISACTFRNVLGVHIFASGAGFSQRKRMCIFRDNDIDTLSTGAPSDLGAISMITSAQTIMVHNSAKATSNSDWVNGDTIFNVAPAAAGATLGWINVGAGNGNSRPMQAQAHYSSGSGAPSANATFIGEEYLDTAGNHWWKAKTTGTGPSDWSQLS